MSLHVILRISACARLLVCWAACRTVQCPVNFVCAACVDTAVFEPSEGGAAAAVRGRGGLLGGLVACGG